MNYRQKINLILDPKLQRYMRRPGFLNRLRWMFGKRPYLVITLPNGDAVTHPENLAAVRQIFEDNLIDVNVRTALASVK